MTGDSNVSAEEVKALRVYESLAAISCLCPSKGRADCFAQNDAYLESWPFSYISSVNVFAIEGGS